MARYTTISLTILPAHKTYVVQRASHIDYCYARLISHLMFKARLLACCPQGSVQDVHFRIEKPSDRLTGPR
jgi:hypothetical protein